MKKMKVNIILFLSICMLVWAQEISISVKSSGTLHPDFASAWIIYDSTEFIDEPPNPPTLENHWTNMWGDKDLGITPNLGEAWIFSPVWIPSASKYHFDHFATVPHEIVVDLPDGFDAQDFTIKRYKTDAHLRWWNADGDGETRDLLLGAEIDDSNDPSSFTIIRNGTEIRNFDAPGVNWWNFEEKINGKYVDFQRLRLNFEFDVNLIGLEDREDAFATKKYKIEVKAKWDDQNFEFDIDKDSVNPGSWTENEILFEEYDD